MAGTASSPVLLLGASIEKSLQEGALSGDRCLYSLECPPDYLAFGPRVELQPLPEWDAALKLLLTNPYEIDPRDVVSPVGMISIGLRLSGRF
jgi:hypothetical protein